jgi:hypothetical protein
LGPLESVAVETSDLTAAMKSLILSLAASAVTSELAISVELSDALGLADAESTGAALALAEEAGETVFPPVAGLHAESPRLRLKATNVVVMIWFLANTVSPSLL